MNLKRISLYALYLLPIIGIAGKIIGWINLSNHIFFQEISEGLILLFLILQGKALFLKFNPGVRMNQVLETETIIHEMEIKSAWRGIGMVIRLFFVIVLSLMGLLMLRLFHTPEFMYSAMFFFLAGILVAGVISYLKKDPYRILITENGIRAYIFNLFEVEWEEIKEIAEKDNWVVFRPNNKPFQDVEYEDLAEPEATLLKELKTQSIIKGILYKNERMKQVLMVFVFMVAGHLGYSQPPQAVYFPKNSKAKKLSFQVVETELTGKDSIIYLYDDPVTGAIVRSFASSVNTINADEESEKILQRGILLENGTRISFPYGEYFFDFEDNKLFTETFHKHPKSGISTSTLKRYLVSGTRLIPQGSQRDTLEEDKSATWYILEGRPAISPRAMNAAMEGRIFVYAEKKDAPNEFTLLFHDKSYRIPNRKSEVILGAKNGPMTSFGLRKMFLTDNQLLLHSAYRRSTDLTTQYLTSAFDMNGNLLWEKTSGGLIEVNNFPTQDVIWVQDHPLVHESLVCTHQETGLKQWETALYELYNNDSKFEFSVISPQDFKVLDVKTVMNGNYHVAVLAHLNKGTTTHADAIAYLFDRKGKVAFQHELTGNVSYVRVKDLGNTFGLVSENKVYRLRPQ